MKPAAAPFRWPYREHRTVAEVDRDMCTNQEHFSTVGCKTLGKPAESVVERAGAEGAANTLARPDHNTYRGGAGYDA